MRIHARTLSRGTDTCGEVVLDAVVRGATMI